MTENTMLFVCPKCGEPLAPDGARAICKGGHSYDRSREGYYNLLLGSRGGTHGDNREMVLARRAFLSGGYYEPLAKRVSEATLSVTPTGGAVLDAGSGEGYYTDAVERALFERDGETCVLAFDISKDAVREVARKNKRISLAVAGSYHMPISDGRIDTVLNTFSPLAISEVGRVLRTEGAFVMAIPGEEHLYDLKCRVYDTPYKNTVSDTAIDGFSLSASEHIKYKFTLDSREKVKNLFMMTPYAYRTPREMKERVLTLDGLECTADFYLLTYRKL